MPSYTSLHFPLIISRLDIKLLFFFFFFNTYLLIPLKLNAGTQTKRFGLACRIFIVCLCVHLSPCVDGFIAVDEKLVAEIYNITAKLCRKQGKLSKRKRNWKITRTTMETSHHYYELWFFFPNRCSPDEREKSGISTIRESVARLGARDFFIL